MFDIVELIKTGGYIGLFLIVLAESGLMIGFFLPGDSLLFTAGFLASQGYLDIYILIPLLLTAAILGDNMGYWIGRKMGPRLFSREDSWFFHKSHVAKTEAFFAKHGMKALILARFVPVVRAFTPVLAGVGKMPYRTFALIDALGGILWAGMITILGYYLGSAIPNIEKYIVPIVGVIIIASVSPVIISIIRARMHGQKPQDIPPEGLL